MPNSEIVNCERWGVCEGIITNILSVKPIILLHKEKKLESKVEIPIGVFLFPKEQVCCPKIYRLVSQNVSVCTDDQNLGFSNLSRWHKTYIHGHMCVTDDYLAMCQLVMIPISRLEIV